MPSTVTQAESTSIVLYDILNSNGDHLPSWRCCSKQKAASCCSHGWHRAMRSSKRMLPLLMKGEKKHVRPLRKGAKGIVSMNFMEAFERSLGWAIHWLKTNKLINKRPDKQEENHATTKGGGIYPPAADNTRTHLMFGHLMNHCLYQ